MTIKSILFSSISILAALIASGSDQAVFADSPAEDAIQKLVEWTKQPVSERSKLLEQPFAKGPLTAKQAARAKEILIKDFRDRLKAEREQEWSKKNIKLGKLEMKFEYRVFGEKPKTGRRLFISMHGGGGAPARVNEQQWKNQIRLYEPKEGVYLAPRAPTNTWNLWHQGHIDDFFQRIIEDAVLFADVDPNRVYIMGYSAGGDGVFQLAPRMADQLAAAAMMAGHPNNASPLGLRNIGFTLHMGGKDSAYNRNKVARDWKKKLADLQKSDPKGYLHEVKIHEQHGHWMNREDGVAVPWMSRFNRDPLPTKIIWHQSGRVHHRFYWLAVDEKNRKGGSLVSVSLEREKPTSSKKSGGPAKIKIEKADRIASLTLRFNDDLVDLDQPIEVTTPDGKSVTRTLNRNVASMYRSLSERFDPDSVFSAELAVAIEPPVGEK